MNITDTNVTETALETGVGEVTFVNPCIEVTKEVSCATNGSAAVDCADLTDYSGAAAGVSGSTFCYRIIVTNCSVGATTFPLTINSVSDNKFGNLIGMFPANTSLDIGQTVTGFVSQVIDVTTTNTVTVIATNGSVSVSDTASATSQVVNASLFCDKQVVSVDGVAVAPTVGCVSIPNDAADHTVVWSITVTNSGSFALNNVEVNESGSAVCVPSLPAVISTLGIGASSNFLCTGIVNCTNLVNGTLVNTNYVTAAVVADGSVGVDAATPDQVIPLRCSGSLSNVCWASVCCHSTCITRTPGFWFNRASSTNPDCVTLLAAIQANGGTLNLGFMTLGPDATTALAQAEGFFWKNKTLTGDGKRADALCKARKQLAFQLIPAIANVAFFGTNPGSCTATPCCGKSGPVSLPSNLITLAQQAAACSNITTINYYTNLLNLFNASGDTTAVPAPYKVCAANPDSKIAVDPTTQALCNNTSNCP